MDELKSENKQKTENELKPDTSDRSPQRSKKQFNQPKLAVSRQQMMIGIGILVLLILIIAISSALKSPTGSEKQPSSNAAEKSINLSGSSSLSSDPSGNEQKNLSEPANNGVHEISPPPINSIPSNNTSSNSTPTPATGIGTGGYNQRIELPGDISDALNQQQSNINNSVQNNLTQPQVKPTQPTVTPPVEQKKSEKAASPNLEKPKKEHKVREDYHAKATDKHVTTHYQANGSDLLKAPANRFTVQLSSASRSDTLIAFAKKNNLSNYKVYETKRDGKTWFILIHGNYSSVSDAKRAISSLPAEIQAKKPWVRKLQQVQQDLKK
ncbi:SPOR domain-containing protein [Xenorhabdus anantnagensis]|uniref:SPOR domain-containing protein n=1 Tax=Xenorhabdus anantnagensis TaxID=3025875 RepID=A0ABT5LUQ5_9GAMM|nr:SPOR domain-containing protein [Xenorhabdus anantnagensis]MDC9598147.1 SPOR domain-containing protein [Xenorhabdus anantnagensis]